MDHNTQRDIHEKSLVVASWFKESYNRFGKEHPLTQQLLSCYIQARRKLPGSKVSGHSTRYGAGEAYNATQE